MRYSYAVTVHMRSQQPAKICALRTWPFAMGLNIGYNDVGVNMIKGGEHMPNTNLEITQKVMEDFVKIQRRMLIAKKENAVETYAS